LHKTTRTFEGLFSCSKKNHAWQKEGGEEKPTLAENAEEAARGG